MREYRVLIVDDNKVDRQLYCRLLATLDPDACHIQQAADGAAGLALLRSEPFDCLLLDFSLPAMNAFEFLAMAAVDGNLPCAVVLITGAGSEQIAVEAMRRGVQDYLVKDQVNADNLHRAVKQAVAQVELRQQLVASLRDLTSANLALEQEAATRKAAETELRTAVAAAEQASLAKTRFVAMVTHELRTPLNGILGYAQLLRLEGDLSARQEMRVGAMMQAGRHLLEMIERVLDFASIEAGRMEMHPEQVTVRDLVEACIFCVSPMATEHNLSLRMVCAHDSPRQIVADPGRLRQVLLNLLGNAVKYTKEGSVELRVLAGAMPGSLRIEVADTGQGIDGTCRDRLFQDFERLEPVSSAEGAGLGLAIAARIVERMGGKINYTANTNIAEPAKSQPALPGSVFWFELPGTQVAPLALADTMEDAPRAPGLRLLLLVDDIKINLDIVSSFLHAAGHRVVLAESGKASVRLAAEQLFDLILMDVRMPEMDGVEAARRIRMLPGAHGKVPILALTAYTAHDEISRCLDAGMDGHISKPVDYETLTRAIDATITSLPASRRADLRG